MYTLGVFQTAASVSHLWLSHIACWPFTSRDSVSYSPLILPELSHTDFQSHILWELLLPLQMLRARDNRLGLDSPCFSGCAPTPGISLLLVGCHLCVRSWFPTVPLSCLPFSMGLFLYPFSFERSAVPVSGFFQSELHYL